MMWRRGRGLAMCIPHAQPFVLAALPLPAVCTCSILFLVFVPAAAASRSFAEPTVLVSCVSIL